MLRVDFCYMPVKSLKNKTTNISKQVKIKHHHVKRYRKRHLSSLAIFIIFSVILIMFSLQYRTQLNRALDGAENYFSTLFGVEQSNQASVSSTYGFTLIYDTRNFYAGGIDSNSGNLFIGDELSTNRAYEQVRVSPSLYINKTAGSSMTITYAKDTPAKDYDDPSLNELESKIIYEGVDTKLTTVQRVFSETVQVGGKSFQKNTWETSAKNGVLSKIKASTTVYLGTLEGKAFIIKINSGTGSGELYNPVIESINFAKPITRLINNGTFANKTKIERSQTILDTVLFTKVAYAAESNINNKEKTTSLYSPAVVKIYNVYCMDILLDGKPYLRDACDGSTGSGFIVSENGYIATNGHVAATSIKDIVILSAVNDVIAGKPQFLAELIDLAKLSESEFSSAKTEEEFAAKIVDALYERLPEDIFTATNNVSNLLVGLNEEKPDIEELIELTTNRKEYTEQNTIKRATLIASDYRVLDGIDGFKASDVAIIKINGDNFPIVKLGDAKSLTQGSELLILGYPGNASDNGLVDSDQSRVTLTSGTVSSIKNASGSDKVLIETDTTIGHGNSGGPALNSSGQVIGLATYTSDGGGKGDGTFNYIRDIKDLKDLAASKSVEFNTESETQKEWEKGIENFYNARYSKALKNFEKVESLYQQHPNVTQFIATSEQKILDGEDIKDFPILLVGIGSLVVVIGLGVTATLIYRQHRGHRAYAGHVAIGGIPPIAKTDPAQQVQYVNVGTPVQPTIAPQATLQTPIPNQPPLAPVSPAPQQTINAPIPPEDKASSPTNQV